MRAVVSDLAALVAVDWPATLEIPGPDAGVDERWWQDRHRIQERWALSIALVHGPMPTAGLDTWMPKHLRAGVADLRRRFPHNARSVQLTETALAQHFFKSQWTGEHGGAAILGWLVPDRAC